MTEIPRNNPPLKKMHPLRGLDQLTPEIPQHVEGVDPEPDQPPRECDPEVPQAIQCEGSGFEVRHDAFRHERQGSANGDPASPTWPDRRVALVRDRVDSDGDHLEAGDHIRHVVDKPGLTPYEFLEHRLR